MTTQIQIDDFHPCAKAVAAMARTLKYGPQEHGGHVYKGIGLGYTPELFYETLSQRLGRQIVPAMEYFRLGTKEDTSTTYIHVDSGCGRHAAVWYLSEPPAGVVAGTAFWRHRETGKDFVTTEDRQDVELLAKLNADGQDESKWIMSGLCGQKFNRLVIYPTDVFHSRYPQDAWGTGPEDGRIVFTTFFD